MTTEELQKDDISYDYELQGELLDKHTNAKFPNLVVKCEIKRCDKLVFDSLEELEKQSILFNEKYDDYYYYLEKNGNLWCSRISMTGDIDSCSTYQERHPEICKDCDSFFRAR